MSTTDTARAAETSYADLLSQLVAHGQASGFRYVTDTEFETASAAKTIPVPSPRTERCECCCGDGTWFDRELRARVTCPDCDGSGEQSRMSCDLCDHRAQHAGVASMLPGREVLCARHLAADEESEQDVVLAAAS